MEKYDDYTPHIFYSEEEKDLQKQNLSSDMNESEAVVKKTKRSAKKVSEKKINTRKTEEEKISAFSSIYALATSRTTTLILGIILAGLSAYFLISFVSYIGSCFSDQSVIYNNPVGSVPEVSNSGGEGGARLAEFFINGGFGIGSFILIIWLVCISLKLLVGKPKFRTIDFTIKCLIGFITLSLIVGLFTIGTNSTVNWGGYHGRYVNEWIIGFLGWWGAVILCIVMIALFVVICMRDVIKWILNKKRILDEKRKAILAKRMEEKERARILAEERSKEQELEQNAETLSSEEYANVADFSFDDYKTEDEEQEEIEKITDLNSVTEYNQEESDRENYIIEETESDKTSISDTPASTELTAETEFKEEIDTSTEDSSPKMIEDQHGSTTMIVNVNHIARADKDKEDYSKQSMYKFPSLSLLRESTERININEEEQLENQERIRQTLLEYGVPIVSIEAHVGPTVTLYEIRPDKGNRIAKIKGLVNEIAMSLAAIGVRIIAPIPGRGTIGIEVANLHPQTVWLRSILGSRKFQETKALLPLALGSTISNEVYIADLATLPHLLVAGATGKGKSVGLNVIIMSLLFKKSPEELKFVMFDPKMVEFNLYTAIQRQYLAKLPDEEDAIITDMKKVVPTLTSLCIEMDNRYALLKEAEVRKLEEYNKLIKSGHFKDDPKHKFLPYIIVVVDEFADLMMTAGKEVEFNIARLAQKARAVGIHVIIATQRPAANIITGNIKNNFTGRIAFQVGAGYDSKTILDTFGAEKLIGKGDMLILNNSELTRVQCAFIDTPEVKAICDYIGSQPAPIDSPYILPEPMATESSGSASGNALAASDKDPLYDEIKSYVIMSGEASTSNLQRKYKLGYNRAGRIMDQLEAEGIVGPSQGGKARSVLVNM